MYPTIGAINSFDVNPLHVPYPTPGAPSTSASSSAPAAPAQPPASRPAANGPASAASPPAPAFPTLQVTINPRFHIAPPVRPPPQPPGQGVPPISSSTGAPPPPGHPAPGSREPLDLDMERRLLRELNAASRSSDSLASSSSGSSAQPREDPYDSLLGRYTGMGYGRDEVAMALTIVGPDSNEDADKIVDACRKFKKLCSMGFRAEHAAGALILHQGDMDAATNTCLDAAG